VPTRVEDLVLVCANCHRIIHRKRPWLSIGELRTLSFAKTGAAHLLVTLANVSGIDRPDDRDSWRA
jgi:hypothetical protein